MKKRNKRNVIIAAAAMTFILGGCGTTPYELTETEENIVVNYSAHIVAKYNAYQMDGLTYVDFEDLEEAEASEAEEDAQEPVDEDSADEPQQGTKDADGSGTVEKQTATLTELFGTDGLGVEYTGEYLIDSYMQGTYYVMYADTGKQYLVVQIAVTNTGGTDVELDNLAAAADFSVTVNAETEAASELTILEEDFAQFQGVIAAGETVDTVLLFQVPDTVTQVEDLELSAAVNGENYQIILE